MSWDVEYTDEFGDWWSGLSEGEQEALDASVRLLEERGPALGFAHSSGMTGRSMLTCENCARSMGTAAANPVRV